MFSARNKVAKRNAAEEARTIVLQGFEENLAAIEKLQDPAEKLRKLEQIKNDIDAVTVLTKGEIRSRSNNKFFAPHLCISGGAFGAAGALAFVAHVAMAPLVALPVVLVGAYVGSRRAAKAKGRLTQASSGFFGALETLKAKATSISETLVKTELPAISTSAKFQDLLAILPSLRNECASAFSKQAAAQKENRVSVEQKKPFGNALTL